MAINPNQRRVIPTIKNDLSLIPNFFEPDYIPKVGLVPYEVSSTVVHTGNEIFNLIDTADMGKEDLLKQLEALDPRILENMPEEVLKQIEDGNIAHIFQTDPTGSQKYMDLSPDAQEALKGKGSIYLRTKEGKTARFKLPEIAEGDAGWNANKGGSIFLDQTVYSTTENIRSLSRANEAKKTVLKGTVAAETIDERILNSNIVDDILSGSQTLTGATAPVGGEDIHSAPKVTTGPTPISAPTPQPAAPPDPPVTGSPSVRTLEPNDKPYTGPRPSWLDKPVAPAAPQPTATTKPTGLPWLDNRNTPPAASTIPPPAAAPTPQPVAPPPQPTATVTPRNQKPIGQPVQAAAPTSAPTAAPTATTKPVGRPVISVTASPPPPTGAGAQQTSAQVTQTGNATPKPVAKVTATVQNTPPAPAKVVTSGAPTPRPILKKTGDDISQALLGGTKGTRNIKLAGAAALLGLGAFAVSRNARPSSDDYERKLEMQRRGMMM